MTYARHFNRGTGKRRGRSLEFEDLQLAAPSPKDVHFDFEETPRTRHPRTRFLIGTDSPDAENSILTAGIVHNDSPSSGRIKKLPLDNLRRRKDLGIEFKRA